MNTQELVRLFYREVDRFAKHYPRVALARLGVERARCVSPGRCTVRDLAYVNLAKGEPLVVLHQRVLRLPRANTLGLIRHELGHIADPTPWLKGAEQRADDIAEKITGQRIRYDGHDIQTVGTGTYPRPLWLHR